MRENIFSFEITALSISLFLSTSFVNKVCMQNCKHTTMLFFNSFYSILTLLDLLSTLVGPWVTERMKKHLPIQANLPSQNNLFLSAGKENWQRRGERLNISILNFPRGNLFQQNCRSCQRIIA